MADNRGVVRGGHPALKQRPARAMRRKMTPAEALLWDELRRTPWAGLHFRRQQVIDGFIADFYYHAAALVIEVDGAVHDERQDYDAARERVLAARGLCILRFPNGRVFEELPAVLRDIQAVAEGRVAIGRK